MEVGRTTYPKGHPNGVAAIAGRGVPDGGCQPHPHVGGSDKVSYGYPPMRGVSCVRHQRGHEYLIRGDLKMGVCETPKEGVKSGGIDLPHPPRELRCPIDTGFEFRVG